MIAKNNEEERSKLWNIVMTASTIIILLVLAFFIVKIFTSNPVEGNWKNDGGNLELTIKSGDQAEICWPEKLNESEAKIEMKYEVDKKNKTIQLQINRDELAKAVETMNQQMTATEIEAALSTMESIYDYSVDGRELTLTDREYGDQLFFEKE